MAQLYRPQLEGQFLSGTLFNPESRAETGQITPSDLSPDSGTVLRAFDATWDECRRTGTPYSEFLVIDRLNSLGLKVGGVLEPGLYVQSLKGLAVNGTAVVGIAKQLYQVTVRRELNGVGREIVRITEREDVHKAADLVAKVTETFNHKVNILAGSREDEPSDLFGTVGDFIHRETVYDTRAIALPYRHYTDLYGALDIGVTTFVSRMKVGKTTLWLSALRDLALTDKDDNFRALVLDTELTKEENQSRAISAATGIKEYLIRFKLYRKHRDMREKVEAAEAELAPLAGKVLHKFVGAHEMSTICSIARRWAYKTLKEGKRGIVVFDYLKLLSNSDFSGKTPLHISIGAKIEALKNLSKELNLPIWTFCQANRSGEDTKEGGRLQNSSIIGGSDMIAQFSSSVMLLERIGPEERMRLCPDLSVKFTHRLLPIATRTLGPDNLGKNRLVRYKDEKGKDRWTDNCLLLNFDSFNVTECREAPTLLDLVERQRTMGVQVQPLSVDEAARALL